jgi:anti-sigma regulatory factor (Ser/Thr protein kinase)
VTSRPLPLREGARLGEASLQATVLAPDALAAVRRVLRSLASEFLGGERLADGLLLTTELVSNSLVHASEPVGVRVELDQRRLRVEVHDHGPGLGRRGPPRLPRAGTLGGRGLFLVSTLADRWGHRDGPAPIVWFEMDVEPSPGPADSG